MKKFCLLAALCVTVPLSAGVTTFENYERDGRPVLIPEVHSYQARGGKLKLPGKFTAVFPKGEEIILEQLTDELKRFPSVAVSAGDGDAFCRFILADKDVPENPQGYKLVIDAKGITVTSRGTDGLFYGAQTLRNLIRNAAGPELSHCGIDDFPDFEERGYTLNISKMPEDRFPQLKRAVDVLASLKINRLFLGMNETFPFGENLLPLRKKAFKAADIRDLHEYCKHRHVLIIPAMQIFSHAKWMMFHPDWDKMREDRAKPQDAAVRSQPCPLNMQARMLTEKALAEIIKFYDAKYFYISMDEIFLCPFHVCEDCVKHDPRELLKDYLAFVFGVLDKHGVTGIICQDSFLNRPPKWTWGDDVRAYLPKGKCIIRWWNYHDQLPEEKMAVFAGHRLFGNAVNGKPFNVWNQARLIRKYGGTGCGMVYWYYSKGGVFSLLEKETPDSLGGLVMGADYLWKVRNEYRPDLGYDGTYEMMRRLCPELLTVVPLELDAAPVPLENVVNAELSTSGKFPRFDSDAAVEDLKKALAALPERFRLVTSPEGKYYALRLTGKGKGRKGAVFKIDRKAEYLSLLLTASRPENGLDYHGYRYGVKRFVYDPAATLYIHYDDGEKAKIPLRYRREITDWNRPFGGFGMRFVVRGLDADKNYFSFGICDIKNPHPEKTIKTLIFSSERLDNISPALLALSLRGADRPFKYSETSFDPAELAGRGGVGADSAPAFNIRADFENGMGDAIVTAPEELAKVLKHEIVADPTSPTNSKVLKITIPAGEYRGRAADEGLVRVSIDMPFTVNKNEKCLLAEAKVVRHGDDNIRCSFYVRDGALDAKPPRKYRKYPIAPLVPAEWRRYLVPFDMRTNPQSRLKDLRKVKFCRMSFFLQNDISAPIEIYVDNIGCSVGSVSDVPLWKEGAEAEPI